MPLAKAAVYLALKADLMTGALPYGRLDIQRLADRLRVSHTPVREALARLAGEHLVTATPPHGFASVALDAAALRDLYVWTDELAALAMKGVRSPRPHIEPLAQWPCAVRSERTEYAHALALLFWEIAEAQESKEIRSQIAQSNDRLFAARIAEPQALAGAREQAGALQSLWRNGDLMPLGEGLAAFHALRVERAEAIALCLQFEPTPKQSS